MLKISSLMNGWRRNGSFVQGLRIEIEFMSGLKWFETSTLIRYEVALRTAGNLIP